MTKEPATDNSSEGKPADSPRRRVHVERLRELGFSEDLINDALEMEKTGLLDIQPRPGLLQRVIEACEHDLQDPIKQGR